MATPPGVAVPGTSIPSGSLVSPGGAQGIQGLQGPAGALPTGAVLDFAGASAPTGFLLCDGSPVSRTTYSALYGVIGTTYGIGDGSTTFNLPDARGRAIVGVGQGSGLTNRPLAASGGEESHVLSVAELAAHNHTNSASSTQGNHTHADSGHAHATGITSASNGQSGAGITYMWPSGSMATTTVAANIQAASAGAITTTVTVNNNGSSAGHNTMAPFIALNKIIKT